MNDNATDYLARLCAERDLAKRFRQLSLVYYGPVTLSSGKESDIFADLMPALMHRPLLDSFGEIICAFADRLGVRQVGGPGVAGAMLLSTALLQPLSGFRGSFVYHSRKNRLEGRFDPLFDTLLLDDVATTGGTLLRIARAVWEAGGSVKHALVVVDREEGAREALAASGITLHRMLTLCDLEAGA